MEIRTRPHPTRLYPQKIENDYISGLFTSRVGVFLASQDGAGRGDPYRPVRFQALLIRDLTQPEEIGTHPDPSRPYRRNCENLLTRPYCQMMTCAKILDSPATFGLVYPYQQYEHKAVQLAASCVRVVQCHASCTIYSPKELHRVL